MNLRVQESKYDSYYMQTINKVHQDPHPYPHFFLSKRCRTATDVTGDGASSCGGDGGVDAPHYRDYLELHSSQ